jgi:exonuclease III
MSRKTNEKSTGSKGCESNETHGLARWGGREKAGVAAPSSSGCNRHGWREQTGVTVPLVGDCKKIGTWNMKSLNVPGKTANLLKEMKRMGVKIMGVSETWWKESGSFTTQLPDGVEGDNYKIFFSGGEKKRRGVGLVVSEEVGKSVLMCEPISERIIVMRLKAAPVNMLIVQIYAPCEDAKEEEKDQFYETLDQVIADFRKGRECLVVMGDFNGKVGNNKEEDTVGPFGLGVQNDNGERVVNFSKRHKLFITNTWFQQRRSAQYTWRSEHENVADQIRNQIDYVLVDKRFRNGILNSKTMPGADCQTDHNPVIITVKIRLQRLRKGRRVARWNISKLKRPEVRSDFARKLEKQLQDGKIDEETDIDRIWRKLKENLEIVAEEICGKDQPKKKQNWMTADILGKMEERRICKNMKDKGKYRKLKHEIQKLCREAKDKYYNDKCEEIATLDKIHSQLLYKKVKELQPKGNKIAQTLKNKQGKILWEKDEVTERWAEYVEELYRDQGRNEVNKDGTDDLVKDVYTISRDEIESVIKDLPKEKACGDDNICAELLQSMGEKGMDIMTSLINNIYISGYIPDDFRKSIFVPIPKVNRAQECSDYRTIALISHASKVLLHLIKRRITPIIERQLGESQMGFRKGKGTRDAIFQLRMITERITQMRGVRKNRRKTLYLCFVDYQKAFDRVKHDKLTEVMAKAGIPDLEMRLIINLYWHQQASVRWQGDVSRDFKVERGVRQGCIISPLLFNLYSEFMIREAMEHMEGIKIGGKNITDIRYADDAVLVADRLERMQKMLDSLRETCNLYGMEINVKKTKIMIVGDRKETKDKLHGIMLDGVPLEQVSRFKYLGSWITETARCEDDIRARVGMATAAFWQNKELMRRNIRLSTKMKILNCYVFSVLNYGCESWTWNAAMRAKVNAFEMWCYRRILKIKYTDGVTNVEVLNRMQTDLKFLSSMRRRKMEFAGHVLRGSSGLAHLEVLEGRVEGKRKVGRPNKTWMDDILKWTGLERYGEVKRAAEDRHRWKLMVVNLRNEEDR